MTIGYYGEDGFDYPDELSALEPLSTVQKLAALKLRASQLSTPARVWERMHSPTPNESHRRVGLTPLPFNLVVLSPAQEVNLEVHSQVVLEGPYFLDFSVLEDVHLDHLTVNGLQIGQQCFFANYSDGGVSARLLNLATRDPREARGLIADAVTPAVAVRLRIKNHSCMTLLVGVSLLGTNPCVKGRADLKAVTAGYARVLHAERLKNAELEERLQELQKVGQRCPNTPAEVAKEFELARGQRALTSFSLYFEVLEKWLRRRSEVGSLTAEETKDFEQRLEASLALLSSGEKKLVAEWHDTVTPPVRFPYTNEETGLVDENEARRLVLGGGARRGDGWILLEEYGDPPILTLDRSLEPFKDVVARRLDDRSQTAAFLEAQKNTVPWDADLDPDDP